MQIGPLYGGGNAEFKPLPRRARHRGRGPGAAELPGRLRSLPIGRVRRPPTI